MQTYKRMKKRDQNTQEQGNESKVQNIFVMRIPKREGEKEK